MRLNTREKNLLALLRKQPATGKELAEKLGVSRRTILRDVRHINEVLQCAHAGFISANSNYTLCVDSHVALEELVQDGCDETTEVLIALLCLPHPTVALIAEKTLLSQARIRKAILAINEHYRALLCVYSRSGHGLELEFKRLGAPDLLAAHLVQQKAAHTLVRHYAQHTQIVVGLMAQELDVYREDLGEWISPLQARLQCEASLATCGRAAHQLAYTKHQIEAVRAFLAQKRALASWLRAQRAALMDLAHELLQQHGMYDSDASLASLIFEHVARAALFPTLATDEFREQVEDLQRLYPFEFDFASLYCKNIEAMRRDLYIVPELCALYVIGAQTGMASTHAHILLLSARKSLEQVNRALLEQVCSDVQITSVNSAARACDMLQAYSFDVCMRDESLEFAGAQSKVWNFSYKGILSDKDLKQLQKIVLYAGYRKRLPLLLPEQNFCRLAVVGDADVADCVAAVGLNASYEQLLKRGLDMFVQRECMSKTEARKVLDREQSSDRLYFKGVAIPHSVTETYASQFRLFAIAPDRAVFADANTAPDKPISLILVVLASQHLQDKNSIFSYLYTVLNTQAQIQPHAQTLASYEAVITFLSQVFKSGE